MFISKRLNGFYYLFYEQNGSRKSISTRLKNKTEARKFLKKFDPNRNAHIPKITHPSLIEYFSEYHEYSKTIHTRKSNIGIQSAFRELIRILGDQDLRNINVRLIDKFLVVKRTEASVWTARKYHIALSGAFETALRWGYISANPFRLVKKPRMPEIQPLFFSKEEFSKLIAGIEEADYKEFYIFAVMTGMRLNEISQLTWDDIDLRNKLIHVRNKAGFTTKSKRNRVIPMNDCLFVMLESKESRNGGERVFIHKNRPFTDILVSKKFKIFVRSVGLNDRLHFHSLRHTFASWLVQEEVPIQYVKELLGHSDIKTTMVYAHLQPAKMHGTVNKISL